MDIRSSMLILSLLCCNVFTFIPGLIAVLCMVAIVILIGRKTRAHFDEQYRLHQAAKA